MRVFYLCFVACLIGFLLLVGWANAQVLEESQLLFTGHDAPVDCVRLLDEDHFVSGSQDG